LTAGEPAGIGPDMVGLLAANILPPGLVVIGDENLIRERAQNLGHTIAVRRFDPGDSTPITGRDEMVVWHVPCTAPVIPGVPDPANSDVVLKTLNIACDGCLDGTFAAMVTAPVHKAVINDAGYEFTGHTEYLAERCGGVQPVMLLVSGELRVALATTHMPLAKVPGALNSAQLTETTQIVIRGLQERFAIESPRVTVLGLNPHAGEGGHLGREELETIEPVVAALRAEGYRITGPVPADSAFTPPAIGGCDVILAMYHDQGLAPLKALGFGRAVNVTLGLPIIRTSVDHGTALDIAGTGKADTASFSEAIALAGQLADLIK
jgi:4-hydroxythreonine-4-phosphate dehydrogenase